MDFIFLDGKIYRPEDVPSGTRCFVSKQGRWKELNRVHEAKPGINGYAKIFLTNLKSGRLLYKNGELVSKKIEGHIELRLDKKC